MHDIKPYPYQEDAVNNIIRKIGLGYKRIILQAVTGAGKTQMMSFFLQRFLKKYPSARVLLLVHRQELEMQGSKTFTLAGLKNVGVEMVETFNNFNKKYPQKIDLLLIDECHRGDFNRTIPNFPDTIILGVTATPVSSNKKKPLNGLYETIVTTPQPRELIDFGSLVRCIQYAPQTGLDKSEFTKKGGSFDEKRMGESFSKPKLVDAVLHAYNKYCEPGNTIVFNTTKEHSNIVNDLFVSAGLPSKHLDSSATTKERKAIFEWFENTHGAILHNVGITCAGYDYKPLRNVIHNYTTDSVVKWLQCTGRGSRIHPQSGKTHFNNIDLGGNLELHGPWNMNRDWAYTFHNPKIPGEGAPPMKECPKCECFIHMSITKCPECGHLMPRKITYSDMILELKIIPDKVERNSHRELDKAIEKSYNKVMKLKVSEKEKKMIFGDSVEMIYDKAGWMFSEKIMNNIFGRFNYKL